MLPLTFQPFGILIFLSLSEDKSQWGCAVMQLKQKLRFVACAVAVALSWNSGISTAAGIKSKDTLKLDDGTELSLTWLIPKFENAAPRALVILQHGMMRRAEKMLSIAHGLLAKNIEVVLPDVSDSQFLDPLFPESFVRAFGKKRLDPAGQSLPNRLLLAGFSAGARFLSHVAALLPNEEQSLRGVLLLDPVVGELPEQQLGPRLQVPYFTILAKPSRCNAEGNVFSLLESGRFQTIGFRLKTASHCDFEGQSSDMLCYLYCGQSSHKNSDAIKFFATEWISGLIDSDSPHSDYLPGGKVFENWQQLGIFDTVFK